jgi:predicted dehydrogenase
MVTDWGAHHLDIAQWGLGMDDSGPVEILPPPNKNDKYGAQLVYANGVPVIHKKGNNVCFYGAEGELNVNRGGFELVHNGETISKYARGTKGTSMGRELLKAKNMFLLDPKVKLYISRNHLDDFLDAVKSRKKPITSEQVGGRSAICCHLMNQAYYNHARIEWDPKTMRFANGTGNPDWLTRDYRQPWVV